MDQIFSLIDKNKEKWIYLYLWLKNLSKKNYINLQHIDSRINMMIN